MGMCKNGFKSLTINVFKVESPDFGVCKQEETFKQTLLALAVY